MANGRCGYTHHTSRYPERGATTCWRPTYEEYDHCVWHTDKSAKPPEAFRERQPSPGERLDGAVLRGVALNDQAWLEETSLIGADFEKSNLDGTSLEGADLRGASFEDAHAKSANFRETDLEDASFDGTKLQKATFDGAFLKDTKLSGSRISQQTSFDDVAVYEEQLWRVDDPDERESQFDSATWVYRQIESVSRRNALFRNVEQYFYREKDLRRRFAWEKQEYAHALRAEGSRWVTGYGRNPWRIVATSSVVVFLCALLYPFLGALRDTATAAAVTYTLAWPLERPLTEVAAVFAKSLYLSVITFATLGSGDVQPVGSGARALAGIESLLGFSLIALLISVLLRRGNWL